MMKWTLIAPLILASTLLSLNSISATLLACQSEQCLEYFNKFKSSAKKGHPQAMAMLGEFYYHGYGVDKNKGLALKYYLKAARKGNTSAQYKAGLLSLLYNEHKNVPLAIKYLNKAAVENYKDANYILARIYLTNEFGIKNLELADIYLAKAYKNKQQDAVKFISTLDARFINQLPKTEQYVALHPVKVLDKDIETITVTSDPIETIFDAQLATYRKPIKSLGTRLKGVDCKDVVGCYKLSSMQELGDFIF
ncbi:tetratricopeptide repeat protein [Thalassotalea atypica]|uniref:tetratricopeptide repeat protein n=1 Tax=Thalassotalea atypica TaxID=2054316 RepID=UPI0025732BA7|nr:tetratricopeptide repeat protein [Thalassotalea atypica]